MLELLALIGILTAGAIADTLITPATSPEPEETPEDDDARMAALAAALQPDVPTAWPGGAAPVDTGPPWQHGGSLADRLSGTEGADWIAGHDGPDWLAGTGGDDVLDGGAGDDTLIGGEGADRISGGSGDDWLAGASGDDLLRGGPGQDTLDGGSGDDILIGSDDAPAPPQADAPDAITLAAAQAATQAGRDHLNGGAGDDLLMPGPEDRASGGAGQDVFALDPDALWAGPAQIMDYDRDADRIALIFPQGVPADPALELRPGDAADEVLIALNGVVLARVAQGAGLSVADIDLIDAGPEAADPRFATALALPETPPPAPIPPDTPQSPYVSADDAARGDDGLVRI